MTPACAQVRAVPVARGRAARQGRVRKAAGGAERRARPAGKGERADGNRGRGAAWRNARELMRKLADSRRKAGILPRRSPLAWRPRRRAARLLLLRARPPARTPRPGRRRRRLGFGTKTAGLVYGPGRRRRPGVRVPCNAVGRSFPRSSTRSIRSRFTETTPNAGE